MGVRKDKRARTQPVASVSFCSVHLEYDVEEDSDGGEDQDEATVLNVSSWCTLRTYDTYEATPRVNEYAQMQIPPWKPLLSKLIDRAAPNLKARQSFMERHAENKVSEA